MPIYNYERHKKVPKGVYQFAHENIVIPTTVDLRESGFLPQVYNQGKLGSCTSFGTSEALEYCLRKEHAINKKVVVFRPSNLYIYYFTRLIEHDVAEDAGAQIYDCMKELRKYGVCSDTMWPYNISKFQDRPPINALIAAKKNMVNLRYFSVQHDLASIKNCLASGFPIIFGVDIYTSFESHETMKTGVIPMPDVNIEENLGGHCILLVSYFDDTKKFIIQNSWGTGVGLNGTGYFSIDYDYVLSPDLASDFWTIKAF